MENKTIYEIIQSLSDKQLSEVKKYAIDVKRMKKDKQALLNIVKEFKGKMPGMMNIDSQTYINLLRNEDKHQKFVS